MDEIKWYEGSFAEEIPRSVIYGGRRLEVDEVVERADVYNTATTGYEIRLIVRCGKRIFRLRKEFDNWQIREEYDT